MPVPAAGRPHTGPIAICVRCRRPSFVTAAGGDALRLRRPTGAEERWLARRWTFALALANVAADDLLLARSGVSADIAEEFARWADAARRADGGGSQGRRSGWRNRGGEDLT